jgi:hypothetical protein
VETFSAKIFSRGMPCGGQRVELGLEFLGCSQGKPNTRHERTLSK